MDLAICTIQRDRAQWLHEWIAFHCLVGFKKFYIYLHKCRDNSAQVVSKLSERYDIEAYTIPDDVPKPQLVSYSHCYNQNGANHDWLAFIDGDEFLFAPNELQISSQLESFDDEDVGALGVYWACFGSSGHVDEPAGLITENFRRRAPQDFSENGHFKSIVRGGQGEKFSTLINAHYFQTRGETVDTERRILRHGQMAHLPCWDRLRINHYVTQSYSYFKNFKQSSGAADFDPNMAREESWWIERDRNEVFDESLTHIAPHLRAMMGT